MGWDWVLTFARSGDRWRQGRRVLDRGLRSAAMSLYRPMLQAKTRVFLSRLLENPQQWDDHLDLSVRFSFDSHHGPEISAKRSGFKGSRSLLWDMDMRYMGGVIDYLMPPKRGLSSRLQESFREPYSSIRFLCVCPLVPLSHWQA